MEYQELCQGYVIAYQKKILPLLQTSDSSMTISCLVDNNDMDQSSACNS